MRARSLLALFAIVVVVAGALGCTKNALIDVAMSGSPHAALHRPIRLGDRFILAGDMHCHVLPPDSPGHVSRGLPKVLDLAHREALDFVVLTPHVRARFFSDPIMRERVRAKYEEMLALLEKLRPDLVVIPGFEYTDHRYGHVGASFANLPSVLESLEHADVATEPARFFQALVDRGGVLTINHPVNRPLRDPPFRELGFDMSWRALSSPGAPVPSEIAWITSHAQAIETFNFSVTYLRDQFIVGEEDRSLREASHLLDGTIRAQRRRIAAVGGSDSHGNWLRATTFVLATERSARGIRDAVVSGRTCVRGPEACTLEVRSMPEVAEATSQAGRASAWVGVGGGLLTGNATSSTTVSTAVSAAGLPRSATTSIQARASGGPVTFLVNGAPEATATSGEIVEVPVPDGRCALVRAIVGRSWSSPIYVNCPFAGDAP